MTHKRIVALVSTLAIAAAAALPMQAQAHRGWLIPSATVLAGEDPWTSFDAAVSNDLFHPDHAPMRLDNLVITGPDGKEAKAENVQLAHYRSTFDLHLTQQGTYRVANVSQGLSVSYTLNGEQKRWRGQLSEDAAEALPAGATDVKITENYGRVETFVTRGAPTAIAAVGKGLELVAVTHPNDVVVGEAATFKLMLDGKPAAGLEVTVAPGNVRYRENRDEMTLKTGADGAFTVTWPAAGLYWINASARGGAGATAGSTRNASYTLVVEVLR